MADAEIADVALVDSPTYVLLRATVEEDDTNPWSMECHPDLDLRMAVELAPEQAPGRVVLNVTHDLSGATNVKSMRPVSIEHRGPQRPPPD